MAALGWERKLWMAFPCPALHTLLAFQLASAMEPCPILQKETLRPGEGTRTPNSCLATFQLSFLTSWVPCHPGALPWPCARSSGWAAVGKPLSA